MTTESRPKVLAWRKYCEAIWRGKMGEDLFNLKNPLVHGRASGVIAMKVQYYIWDTKDRIEGEIKIGNGEDVDEELINIGIASLIGSAQYKIPWREIMTFEAEKVFIGLHTRRAENKRREKLGPGVPLENYLGKIKIFRDLLCRNLLDRLIGKSYSVATSMLRAIVSSDTQEALDLQKALLLLDNSYPVDGRRIDVVPLYFLTWPYSENSTQELAEHLQKHCNKEYCDKHYEVVREGLEDGLVQLDSLRATEKNEAIDSAPDAFNSYLWRYSVASWVEQNPQLVLRYSNKSP